MENSLIPTIKTWMGIGKRNQWFTKENERIETIQKKGKRRIV